MASNEIEEMRPGARNAVDACMGIGSNDRVYVLTDRVTHPIGQVIYEEAARTGAQAEVHDVEEYTVRPVTTLPESLRVALQEYRPTVTFYAASAQPGEVSFRTALRVFLLEQVGVRHGHMPGINRQLMVEGMRTDYRKIAEATHAVYELAQRARRAHVTTPDGTDLAAEFDPGLRWIPSTGIYHAQGGWGNLPDGETFTCPATVSGVLVAHVLGDYFSEKYGVLKNPVTIEIRDGLVQSARCTDRKIADEFLAYLDSAENGRRTGEFAIGTNIGLDHLVGNLLQDEKLPGLHVAFGNPYPTETGAQWTSKVHVDVIAVQCTITLDGKTIMRDGEFDYGALGLPEMRA